MADEGERRRALELAARALGARDRTVAELRSLLERRGVEADAIEAAVGELEGSGALDDERYARSFAEDKRSLERWGPERIAATLERRGVAVAKIEAALGEETRERQLEGAALLLAERVGAPPRDDRERDQAWRLLVRRGYEPELAYDAVRAFERAA